MAIPEEYRELSAMLEKFRRHVGSPLIAVVVAEECEGEGEVPAGHIRMAVAAVYSVNAPEAAVPLIGLSQLLMMSGEHLVEEGHTTFRGGDPVGEKVH